MIQLDRETQRSFPCHIREKQMLSMSPQVSANKDINVVTGCLLLRDPLRTLHGAHPPALLS